MVTVIRRSPGGWPGAVSPCPFSRICWPAVTPAGILTLSSLPVGSRTRFSPPLTASSSDTVMATVRSRSSAMPPVSNSNVAAAARPRAARRRAAEHAVEDVLETAAAGRRRRRRCGRCGSRSRRGPARPPPAPPPGKPWKRGLPSASISPRSNCLRLSSSPMISLAEFNLGKPRRGFRIVLVGVGVMLLGELAIGALDRRSAGAPRHPQDLIGVAHPSRLLQGNQMLDRRAVRPLWTSSGDPVAFLQRVSLNRASTASACEFPTGRGQSGRRHPAASFRCCR